MNKETNKVLKFLENNPIELKKVRELKRKHTNYKDFYNQFGYLIMEILNTKEFINLSRKAVDLEFLTDKYF